MPLIQSRRHFIAHFWVLFCDILRFVRVVFQIEKQRCDFARVAMKIGHWRTIFILHNRLNELPFLMTVVKSLTVFFSGQKGSSDARHASEPRP